MSFSQGATVKRVHKNRFGCEHCNYTFVHKNLLRQHLACVHLDPFLYKCSRCSYFNNSRAGIQIHLQIEHGGARNAKVVKNGIICELCSVRFPSRSELENHVIQRHSAELQCPACEEDEHFLTKESLKSHFISEHGESLWGSYVGSMYKEAYHRVHKLKVDPYTREYCCYICNRNSSAGRIALFRHVTGHLDLYPYCCPECPYMSEVRNTVVQHCGRNHPKSKSMHKIVNRFARWDHKLGVTARRTYCQDDTLTQVSTGFQENLLPVLNNAKKEKELSVPSNSIKATFSAESLIMDSFYRELEESGATRSTDQSCFVCNFCGSSFVSKPQLQQHMSSLHARHNRGELNQFTNENIPEKEKSKKTKLPRTEYDRKEPHDTKFAGFCYLCDSQFTSYMEFYTHTLEHEERAVYRCSTCSHTSIGLIVIRKHVKLKHPAQEKLAIQLVPMDLSCKTCIDLRSNKEELQNHVSRAHDVRLHCPLCQKLFGDVTLLRKHLVQEHGTEQWASNVHAVCKELKEKLRYLKPDPLNRFICFYCIRAFNDKCGLFTHLRFVHLRWKSETLTSDMNREKGCMTSYKKRVRGSFYCYICPNSRLTTKAELMKHLHKHRDKNISLPYFCKSCGEFCAHRNSMEVHWYENHGESVVRFTRIPRTVEFRLRFLSNFPCRYCNVYLKTETRRKRHESEKHAENYKCSGCNFACENIDMMKIHITVVHAKSDPKPSMVRRKLCPVSTSGDVLDFTKVQNQWTAEEEAFLNPNLLVNHHGIKSSTIKMESDDTNLLNFEFVECKPVLQKPPTERGPATLVGQDQNLVSIHRSRGFNPQLTGSNSSPEWRVSKSSVTSASHPAKSGPEIGDKKNNTVLLSSTSAEAPICGNAYNTTYKFFNVKEEMEFEDVVIKEESLDREDSNSTEDCIAYPITPFQVQALSSLTEVKSFKTEDLYLQQEHAQSEALPETADLSCVQTEEPILHHQIPVQSHVLPARTKSQLSPQEQIAITEAQLRVRETAEDFHYQAYPCYLCPKMMSTRSLLIRHVVGPHLKVRLYECAYCARRCSRESDVRQHSAIAHPGQPTHVVTRFKLDMFGGRRDRAPLGKQGTKQPA